MKAKKEKEETTEPKLVAVEMTEKEKEEFAKFMADREEKKESPPEDIAHGELRFEHRINNIPYGPGAFEAPVTVARNLVAADEKYLRRKMKEKESEEYMIDIQSRGPGRIKQIIKSDVL